MLNGNNNLSALPFYGSIEEQNHRKPYAYCRVFPLVTPLNRLLPFQIMREHRNAAITDVRLYTIDGVDVLGNCVDLLNMSGLRIISDTEIDVIMYTSLLPIIASSTRIGQHYLRLYDGVEYYYSEVFTFIRSVLDCLKLTWYDYEDLISDASIIRYKIDGGYFKNWVYLQTMIGKPEYPFTEEIEDIDGYGFVEKQLSEKSYKFTFLAPEYLLDALRIVRLSDHIEVYSRGVTYNCDTISITPEWLDQGDLATVTAEFQTNTVIKKIGRGDAPFLNRGDFNNDFNEDFYNQ